MVESKAAFARRMGWKNRSTATRYAEAGKIVLDKDGLVEVELSQARLDASKDPDKEGVRQRHARARRGQDQDDGADDLKVDAGDTGYQQLTKYRARAEAERATLLRLEREQLEGRLVDAEAVAKRAHQVARAARDAVMNMRFRLDPLLAGEVDPQKRAEIWDRETRQVCEELARGVAAPLKAESV